MEQKYKITITCTDEHTRKSMWCSMGNEYGKNYHTMKGFEVGATTNCRIALAVQEIFPLCTVDGHVISNSHRIKENMDSKEWKIAIPIAAKKMIYEFDDKTPEQRLLMPEFSFDIEFDQKTLETILECNGFKSMQKFEERIFDAPHLKLQTI